jgi:hypothetical protein
VTPDIVNAVFEGGGAVLLCANIRRLYCDKRLAGVSLVPTVWWNIWGVWNVYFYHAIGTPLSFFAGIGVLVANTVWVALALYYARRRRGCNAGRHAYACGCKS